MTQHLLLAPGREWPLVASPCSAGEIATPGIAKLDHHAARDLGISLGQLQFEAQKPFWRA